jgi:hypothetical protein
MPIRPALMNEIRAALGNAIVPSLSDYSAASDIYEAYIFALILQAARAEGATISFKDVSGVAPTVFVFRTSPGHLFSRAQPYAHAVITFPGKAALEAHIGVRVFGISKVLHECDVAVITRDEAETCRRLRVSPRHVKAIIAVECKFYTSDIPLTLARSFLGLSKDLTANNRYFVVNTTSTSVAKMLGHHHKHGWDHQIVPSSTTPVERLRNSFQNSFKNYKAT